MGSGARPEPWPPFGRLRHMYAAGDDRLQHRSSELPDRLLFARTLQQVRVAWLGGFVVVQRAGPYQRCVRNSGREGSRGGIQRLVRRQDLSGILARPLVCLFVAGSGWGYVHLDRERRGANWTEYNSRRPEASALAALRHRRYRADPGFELHADSESAVGALQRRRRRL